MTNEPIRGQLIAEGAEWGGSSTFPAREKSGGPYAVVRVDWVPEVSDAEKDAAQGFFSDAEPDYGSGEYWNERWRETYQALVAAVARAEVAEESLRRSGEKLKAMNRFAVKQRDRAIAAETRLAERDASFNRLRWRG